MTYLPPFARMRQIRREAVVPATPPAPPVTVPEPANVVEALNRVFVVEEPVTLPFSGVDVATGPDYLEDAAFVTEDAPEPVEPPKWNPNMRKADLIKVALQMGLTVDEMMTKNLIIGLLQGT